MRKLLPGALVAIIVAAVAWFIAPHVRPWIGVDATFLALVGGLSVGAATRHPGGIEPGVQRTLKHALVAGVILLGAEVSLGFLLDAGLKAVALAAALIGLTLLSFFILARALGVAGDTWALLGAGTGICGLSAVAAAGASLKSKDEDIAVSVAAVGLLSAVGLLLYPVLGALLRLPASVYGAWSGLSVHAVANAVAAGFAFGDEAGQLATVTKLARVALLAPMLLVVTLALRHKAQAKRGKDALLPPMVWGFLAVAVLTSVLPLPGVILAWAKLAAKVALVLGMAALGLATRLGHFRRAGPRGIALAVGGWAILSFGALVGAILFYG